MTKEDRQVRIGMVGGGPGAGIAESHRIGMRIDGRFALVAGVFSRSPENSQQTAHRLGVAAERSYASFEEMANTEATRPDGIEVVTIVTPNDSHFPIAKTFLQAGIHVVCEKPLTDTLDHAVELDRLARDRELILALTHNYSGYAMVRHAAALVRDGGIGPVRIVQVEHASGWAAGPVEGRWAGWRTDPAVAGGSPPVTPNSSSLLTPREQDVLGRLAEGLPNKGVASRLEVSEHTVKFHVNSIMGKLNAQSRTEAVTLATRMGLLPL